MRQNTFTSFILAMRQRRLMFFPDHDDCYAQVVAGIVGFDYATQGGALMGFREWLVMRSGALSNLAWFAIVESIASERGVTLPEKKVVLLLDLVDEYLGEREKKGATRLFREYCRWEQERFSASDTER
ncbi:MAG: hypothetical protein HC888_16375 [Candidatus Competibacteraceae bacterium]|nr:hypothetical protein [Candidatus Competibacteraceae bacterium]